MKHPSWNGVKIFSTGRGRNNPQALHKWIQPLCNATEVKVEEELNLVDTQTLDELRRIGYRTSHLTLWITKVILLVHRVSLLYCVPRSSDSRTKP